MKSASNVWRERGLKDAALAGDAAAWRFLFDLAYEPLARYLHWRLGSYSSHREDLAQETWLVVARKLGTFQPERSGFTDWVLGIARQLLRNHYRKQKRTVALRGDEEAGGRNEDEAAQIAYALAQLPDHYENVLRMKYLDCLTVSEMAGQLEQTDKAVESLLTRAREAFRNQYKAMNHV